MKKHSLFLSFFCLLLCVVLLSFTSCKNEIGEPQDNAPDSEQTVNDTVEGTHPIAVLREALRASENYEMTFRFTSDVYGVVTVTVKTDGAKTYMENTATGIKQYTETQGDTLHVYTENANGWQKEVLPADSTNTSTKADFDALFGEKNYAVSEQDPALYLMKNDKTPNGMRDVSLRITDTGCVITALTAQEEDTLPTEITLSGIGTTAITLPEI